MLKLISVGSSISPKGGGNISNKISCVLLNQVYKSTDYIAMNN